MPKQKTAIILIALITVFSVSFITIGLFTEEPLYFLVALWIALPVSIALFAIIILLYKRVGRTHQLLRNLEKKVDICRDEMSQQILIDLRPMLSSVVRTELNTALSTDKTKHDEELIQINARLRNTEARILGRLENELLTADKRVRSLENLVSETHSSIERKMERD